MNDLIKLTLSILGIVGATIIYTLIIERKLKKRQKKMKLKKRRKGK